MNLFKYLEPLGYFKASIIRETELVIPAIDVLHCSNFPKVYHVLLTVLKYTKLPLNSVKSKTRFHISSGRYIFMMY